MSPVMYVVHSPLRMISESLCPEQGSVLMNSLKDSLLPGMVLSTTKEFPREDGAGLSYEQVVSVLLKREQIETL